MKPNTTLPKEANSPGPELDKIIKNKTNPMAVVVNNHI